MNLSSSVHVLLFNEHLSVDFFVYSFCSPSVGDWCLRNGRTSKVWSFSGGTRSGWTTPSGERGTFSVRAAARYRTFCCVSSALLLSHVFALCRSGEESEPGLPLCHAVGWDHGFRSPSACGGERRRAETSEYGAGALDVKGRRCDRKPLPSNQLLLISLILVMFYKKKKNLQSLW